VASAIEPVDEPRSRGPSSQAAAAVAAAAEGVAGAAAEGDIPLDDL
jgi:hypothetical protein